MPRKSRKKQPDSPAGLSASEPVTVAEVLAESPIKALIDAQEAKSRVEPERPMPEPDGSEAVAAFERQRKREQAVEEPQIPIGNHTAAVLARRPKLAKAPPGFFEVASDRQAGIRVLKSHDHKTSALQFSDDRPPTRPEKDIMERVGQPEDGLNYVYQQAPKKIWERPTPPGWTPGENTIDTVRQMGDLAAGRNGRGR